ncbi:MAG: hypothetical protein K6F33_07850 [Bacteroidales bacterium]|nr:hypothetical protein [Bacteroidales bacterium]
MARKKHPYSSDKETGETNISNIEPEAFLIKDDSLKKTDAPFYKWLDKHNFKYAWHKGHYGCEWVFVNITHKLYAYGMPGVEIIKSIGNHAITIDEFMIIYEIYEKYSGLLPLQFPEDESAEK